MPLPTIPEEEISDFENVVFIVTYAKIDEFIEKYHELYQEDYLQKQVIFIHRPIDDDHWTVYSKAKAKNEFNKYPIRGDGLCGLHSVAVALQLITNEYLTEIDRYGYYSFSDIEKTFDLIGIKNSDDHNKENLYKRLTDLVSEPENENLWLDDKNIQDMIAFASQNERGLKNFTLGQTINIIPQNSRDSDYQRQLDELFAGNDKTSLSASVMHVFEQYKELEFETQDGIMKCYQHHKLSSLINFREIKRFDELIDFVKESVTYLDKDAISLILKVMDFNRYDLGLDHVDGFGKECKFFGISLNVDEDRKKKVEKIDECINLLKLNLESQDLQSKKDRKILFSRYTKKENSISKEIIYNDESNIEAVNISVDFANDKKIFAMVNFLNYLTYPHENEKNSSSKENQEEFDRFKLVPKKFYGFGLKINLTKDNLFFEKCYNDEFRDHFKEEEGQKITHINDKTIAEHIEIAANLRIDKNFYFASLFRSEEDKISIKFEDREKIVLEASKRKVFEVSNQNCIPCADDNFIKQEDDLKKKIDDELNKRFKKSTSTDSQKPSSQTHFGNASPIYISCPVPQKRF